ncbi:MAG TPA: MFS transporter [Azospirillaceae bacterium]|nr:MFS transporter [Azospirillaceae bacterium]
MSRSTLVLVCGSLALFLTMGIRQDFGLLLAPITRDTGWAVGGLALGFALQQIVWGLVQPVAGAIADTKGPRLVVAGGGLLYAAGLVTMAAGGSVPAFQVGAGLLVGAALASVSFSVVLGAITRAAPPEKRISYAGMATAGASFGMFAFVPVGRELIGSFGWQGALFGLASISLLILPLSLALGGRPAAPATSAVPGPSLREALGMAMGHPGFRLLTLGFFVCGFHLAFVSVHLPAYVASCGLPDSVGAYGLALIGLGNVVGSLAAGKLGSRHRPKYLLAGIYAARGIAIAALLLAPKTAPVVLTFTAVMGLLWLSTVPLTSGIVTGIFGPRYASTLFGIVFLSHQVGGFLGAWLGGVSYDLSGSYDAIWYASLALAAFATIVHLPIRDRRLEAFAAA